MSSLNTYIRTCRNSADVVAEGRVDDPECGSTGSAGASQRRVVGPPGAHERTALGVSGVLDAFGRDR